jgi:hypothetical protein
LKFDKYFDEKSDGNIEFCLTSSSNLLVIVLNKQICCLDVESLHLQYKKTLQLEEKVQNIELRPVIDSDNIIILINKQWLFYLTFSKNNAEGPIIIEQNFNNCVYLLVEKKILVLVNHTIKNKEEILISKLMDGSINLIFKETSSELNDIKYCNVTPDCQYLSLFSENKKVLKLYRINNDTCGDKLIGEIPILSSVNCMSVNNKYIILGIDENRILSYLILDYKNKAHENRVRLKCTHNGVNFTQKVGNDT